MAFIGRSLESDVREYAIRLDRRLRRKGVHLAILQEVISAPNLSGLQELERQFEFPAGEERGEEVVRVKVRLRIYRMCWGDADAASALAGDILHIALVNKVDEEVFVRLTGRALDLLSSSAYLGQRPPFAGGQRAFYSSPPDSRMEQSFDVIGDIEIAKASLEKQSEPTPDQAVADNEQVNEAPADFDGVVVIADVGTPYTSEGRKTADAVRKLIGVKLPTNIPNDLQEAWRILVSEFPYATDVVDRIFLRVASRRDRIEPTILVGAQGSGKSRFTRRLGQVLGLGTDIVPFAGLADSTIAGTSRHWATGGPSIALAAVMRHNIANPLIVVDELDKTSDGGHNGNALHALLPFLETETSVALRDPWLQAPVDLSKVSWLMTANTTDGLSAPLRDRCSIMRFPSPEQRHLDALLPTLIAELAVERGDPFVAALPLDGGERRALRFWTDGSLRTLRRMVSQILDDRERRMRVMVT